ncbi:ElyC/SanA/YdcF family protein [Geodermatophilus sp. CPCC 205506]|uniref:ElyC/SanA/YdcF family protein n=1 Tax=Geodermatophilus sp. CPCC 205506 TaxID=2936596 RepID=UPI003EEC1039
MLALTLAAVVLTHAILFPPVADDAASSEAVALLAGSPTDRLPRALRLAEQGGGVLVVSAAGGAANAPARALCRDPGDLEVYCFRPSPPDTRGEARAIGRLVEEHGWSRITVVTSTYHLARAGLLVRRCTDAEVVMAEAEPSIPVGTWARQLLHEMAGFVEATLHRSC